MPLLILFLALPIFAQNSPQWLEESWRASRYPNAEWYTGFARDKINEQPNSKNYQAIEDEAKKKLSESIQVKIQSSATTQTSGKQSQTGSNASEVVKIKYNKSINTQSNIVLAKMDVKSYFNENTNYIYAFASIKKRELADFYRSKISALFSFAGREFIMAEQFIEQSKKKQALDKIYEIEDSLKIVGYWDSYLQAVENDNSYTAKEAALWQKANSIKMQLMRGTAVYLDISGDNNLDKLDAEMQEKGCNCIVAKEKRNADYTVAIKAKLIRCNENNYGEVYCYANANVTVKSSKNKNPVSIKIPEAKGGWGNRNKDKAIEESFKELTNYLAEKIIQTINQ